MLSDGIRRNAGWVCWLRRASSPEGLHDRDGLGDGIHALPGLHRVPRFADDADAEPEDPDVGVGEAAAGRLGDDRGVRVVAAGGVEGAVAGAFLLDHALDDEIAGELDAEIAQETGQHQVEGVAALHVVGAAAVHAVADDGRLATDRTTRPRPAPVRRRRCALARSGTGRHLTPSECRRRSGGRERARRCRQRLGSAFDSSRRDPRRRRRDPAPRGLVRDVRLVASASASIWVAALDPRRSR